MYLMNVPPVAATQTEWRTCGPPGGYSLPICFNDSDTELSIRGSPITNKVQMIIESLRSTQSSLEMGDEIKGNVLSGQEVHPQLCKVAVGSFVGGKSKIKSPSENQQARVSTIKQESSGSDSDDSVDRGIEEAILEYLKEKDDHKRKAEPCATFLQSSKIPKQSLPIPDIPKLRPDSNAVSMASSQLPKSAKAEISTTQTAIPLKKYIRNKASLHESPVRSFESKITAKSLLLPDHPSKTNRQIFNQVRCQGNVEDSNYSSSDDGIEEAIQRYQLEKKVNQNKDESYKPDMSVNESDSSSDDGIEEAIRTYQLQQLKEKSSMKPFVHKKKSKPLINAYGSTSTENMKKHKLRQKKNRTEKEIKSVLPPQSFFLPKNITADNQRSKGNGLLSFQVDRFKEQPVLTPPKVNTTAELMCAEAILDISKTVMPGAFHHTTGLGSCIPAESVLQSTPDAESDDSSVDSEDGIEQEIMKFLEQKAKMHQQPPSSAVTQQPHCMNESEKMKTKQVITHKNRLSLTHRRKQREENSSNCSVTEMDKNIEDASPKPLREQMGELSPLPFSQKSQTQPVVGLDKTEQSEEKSSSLDSDEDLDTAIKDLLKTKKKLKRRTRDLKHNSRKCLKEEESLPSNVLHAKKIKMDPSSRQSALKKVHKSKNDRPQLVRKNISKNKPIEKSKVHSLQDRVTEKLKGNGCHDTPLLYSTALQSKEDSSSVDSDDSIEQEIRKFLAEKAEKVSTAEKDKDGARSRNNTIVCSTPLQERDIKQENQLAEIPRICVNPLSGSTSLYSPLIKPPPGGPLPPTLPCLLPSQVSVGAHSSSFGQSLSCSLLEPADGAGTLRSEQTRPAVGRDDCQNGTSQMERVRPMLTPTADHARSESLKWRQSLGLLSGETRNINRIPFLISSSKNSETQDSRGSNLKWQIPVSNWSPARSSRVPTTCSAEKSVHTSVVSPIPNLLSTARHHQGISFPQSILPGHRSQCPIEETESMVHMPKDKSVFVELESDRTNHVQVRSRERIEGKERAELPMTIKRENESVKIGDNQVRLVETKEEVIDEEDCESGSEKKPERKQGFSNE